jgi:hypothetical protein
MTNFKYINVEADELLKQLLSNPNKTLAMLLLPMRVSNIILLNAANMNNLILYLYASCLYRMADLYL